MGGGGGVRALTMGVGCKVCASARGARLAGCEVAAGVSHDSHDKTRGVRMLHGCEARSIQGVRRVGAQGPRTGVRRVGARVCWHRGRALWGACGVPLWGCLGIPGVRAVARVARPCGVPLWGCLGIPGVRAVARVARPWGPACGGGHGGGWTGPGPACETPALGPCRASL